MALLPPAVIGPLSECSSRVKVQGQLIGATVDLFANGIHVGGGVATWTDQVFPLTGGATLAPGSNVTATQSMGGSVSPQSPAPVTVQKKPPTLGHVGAKSHIYMCGQCLWLDGMVPGAKVDVTVGGVPRGSGIADDGSARFPLSAPTALSDTLVAQQIACGTPGPLTTLPAPDPLPGKQRFLAPPKVNGPLRACQHSVLVSDVVDGAQVTLTEIPGFSETACFDLPALWFICPPLTLGASVSAVQKMPGCEITSGPSAPVVVGPPTPVPAPVVVPPLCAGSVFVRLTNLMPGSPVEIFQGATSLGLGSAPEATFDFPVPPLAGGAIITARQELCTNWSAPSGGVKVDPHPASLPTPVVASPLVECGAAVHVDNLHPGATVYVFSTLLGAPIGTQDVFFTSADVPVAPQLIKGDQIFAVQHGCGLVSSKSALVTVQPLIKPGPPKVLPPVETCMRSVTVGNVVPGAHVDLYVNGGWRGSAIATGPTVEIPVLFGPLHAGDAVTARQMICDYIAGPGEPVIVVSSAGFYYLTQHFDISRTGWMPYETTLNPGNVPHLKQKFTHAVDGTVYAQPLYAHHVNIPGMGAHNVVYVATENDSVYAFDADTNQPALWHRRLVPAGESVVSWTDVTVGSAQCPNVKPVIGITSTPVIDCSTYTMYVVAKTKRVSGGSTTYHYRIYALDIATGADRVPPAEIAGSVPGSGNPSDGHGHVVFDPHWHLNRPGLLLLNGVVYVGFGSHCDQHLESYHGWVFGFSAASLAQVGIFSSCPDTPTESTNAAAGIWQGGMGLAGEPSGAAGGPEFIYFTTGNGDLTANVTGGKNYGDCVVKLRSNFTVADFFAPADQLTLLSGDIDLGSCGVVLLPGDRPLLTLCGKDGRIFLLNRAGLGGYKNGPGGTDLVVQEVDLQPGRGGQPGIWGGPAYYRNSQQQFVYYCGNGSHLRAYTFSGAAITFATQSPNASPGEGGFTPNVSSNGQATGTGVVWGITRENPLHLHAYDAANVATQLLDVTCGPWNNPDGGPFIEPTVIQGKVYVASDGQLTVFGL